MHTGRDCLFCCRGGAVLWLESNAACRCGVWAVMAGVERFANKGVGSNLVTYLTSVVGMSTAAAAKSVIAWNGVSFMLPLVSAVLADSAHWDRYCTIAASSLLYVLVTPSSS
jgi:solute carrier family 15 (peptide/histidine transporter), member 3/4